jgi:hypothetical protein
MRIIFTLSVLTFFVILWVTLVRPWLRNRRWACDFFAAVEPYELWIYEKSESILWARWQQLLGFVLLLTGLLGGIDYTPLAVFTPDWIDPLLPGIPVILNIAGTVAERLRRDTTKPLEVVALPIEKPPAVEQAVARLETAKNVAEVVIERAKEGVK